MRDVVVCVCVCIGGEVADSFFGQVFKKGGYFSDLVQVQTAGRAAGIDQLLW